MIIFAQIIFLLFLLAAAFFYVYFLFKKEKMYHRLMEVAVWIVIFVTEIADLKLLKFGIWNFAIILVALTFVISKTIGLISDRSDSDKFGYEEEVITNPDFDI